MPRKDANAKAQQALLDLLDDPSPTVRKELLLTFDRMGPEGAALLESTANSGNRLLSWHARWFLSELRSSNPVEEFRAFVRSMNYELESGWLLLSRVASPTLDVGHICGSLDLIANRCRELLIEPSSTRDKCLVMNRVLFHEMGFRGNPDDYENPQNSLIDQILERRKGIPISLATLYLLIGDRLDANLEPVGAPGHFLVGCFDEMTPYYIDAYERGRFLSAPQLKTQVENSFGEIDIHHLAPSSTRETLCRFCRNLIRHFTLAQHPHMANLFQSFLQDFQHTYERQSQA